MRNLNEFHEIVDILGIKLSREVLNSLVKILHQWILSPSYWKLCSTYIFSVFPRLLHIRTFSKHTHKRTNIGNIETHTHTHIYIYIYEKGPRIVLEQEVALCMSFWRWFGFWVSVFGLDLFIFLKESTQLSVDHRWLVSPWLLVKWSGVFLDFVISVL